MRSFSKKLAFVLAAAMVVTTFAPAASAEAAKEMAINKSSKILYVTDGTGINDAAQVGGGKGNVSSYDFSVKNKPADWKSTLSFKWTSSNEDVATVENGGLVTAVSAGKATISCKITEKATGEVVTTAKTKVTVKKNAAEVVITNADDYDGTVVEVDGVVDLNRAMYDVDGTKTTKRGTVVTDYTKWVAEPSKGVEITQSNGTFKFTEEAEAGEYKLYCYTYQSSKYEDATATSDAVVVEFQKADKFEVDQTASNGFNVVFGKEADVKIADVTVNKIIAVGNSTGKFPVVVKDVTMSEDKKTASVSLFSNFDNGATYEISVKGYEEVITLVAFIGAPKTMTISSNSGIQGGMFVTTNTTADLTYKLFDEQGNDITNTVNGYVVFTAANAATADYYVSGNSICIYKNGAEVSVTGVYHSGEFDADGNEITVTGTGYFIGMDKAADSIVETSLVLKRWGSVEYTNNQIPVNDYQVKFEFKLKTTVQDDALTAYGYGAPVDNLANGSVVPTVRFRSSNPDVMDIVAGEDGTLNEIKPFKEGTAAILVDLVSWENGIETVNTIAATYVTIIPKRVLTTVAVGNGATVVVGDYDLGTENNGKLSLTVQDQYGTDVDVTSLTDIKYAANGTAVPAGAVTFEARNATNGWTNYIVVNNDVLGDNTYPTGKNEVALQLVAKVVSAPYSYDYAEREIRFKVVVKKPTGGEYYGVELAGTTSGNVGRYATTADDNAEALKSVQFKVFTKKNNVKVAQNAVTQKPSNNVVASGTAVGTLFFSVTHNNVDITEYATFDGNTVVLDYSDVKYVQMLKDGVVGYYPSVGYKKQVMDEALGYNVDGKDLGAGTYVFTLYKVVADSTNTKFTFAYVDSISANVSVDTGSYSLVKRTAESATHTNADGVSFTYTSANGVTDAANQAALRDCFKVNNKDGKNADTTVYFVDAVDTVNYVNVKSITFFEVVGETEDGSALYAPYTVNINVSLKK